MGIGASASLEGPGSPIGKNITKSDIPNYMIILVEDDGSSVRIRRPSKDKDLSDQCTSAEAAELIIASTGTELQALITEST